MKKLSLIFALVLAVSMVMAQKTTFVTQSGTSNIANVTQNSMDGDANAIYATQSGDFNELNTLQNGNNNYIDLLQSGLFNDATMEQFTKGTTPNLNNAVIAQSNVGNEATLTQKENPLNFPDDSHNVSHASQSGSLNTFTLNQGGNEWSPVNENYLVQSGIDNTATIFQFGYTDYSDISQSGVSNETTLHQLAGQGGAGTAYSTSYQEGTLNTIGILQDYDPLSQVANSVQNGTLNTTSIDQEGNGVQTVTAQQLGTDILNVFQNGF